ncbi:MAG: ParB/RepB/Spo0J family partition protein [Pseudoflavonifractor sp.]
MAFLHKKGLFEHNRVLFLPLTALLPNPSQPRKFFSPEGLEELAASIREHGVLQPLSVRRTETGYELISGERRLRAAKLAELTQVPCIVVAVDREGSSLLALVENLQRRDLDFVEEAVALAQLIRTYGLSQEEAARKIGKSQSAVANKLRLLRLPPEVLSTLREGGCTERHARALLRLEDEAAQGLAATYIVENGLNVARTEEYIEGLLHPPEAPPKPARRKRPTLMIKDVRFFLNTVTHGLSIMKSAGFHADCQQQETEDSILLTIRIPKAAS